MGILHKSSYKPCNAFGFLGVYGLIYAATLHTAPRRVSFRLFVGLFVVGDDDYVAAFFFGGDHGFTSCF